MWYNLLTDHGGPASGCARRVGGGFERRDRDLMAAMVGVRISAVLVIGRHDVRAELRMSLTNPGDGFLHRHQRKATLRQRGRRITLRQTGVDEAQPPVLDAENLGGPGHLVASDVADPAVDLREVHRRVQDVAAARPGQGDHEHAVASST